MHSPSGIPCIYCVSDKKGVLKKSENVILRNGSDEGSPSNLQCFLEILRLRRSHDIPFLTAHFVTLVTFVTFVTFVTLVTKDKKEPRKRQYHLVKNRQRADERKRSSARFI